MVTQRPQDPGTESFAGLLLRHRGRTGLTQRDLAARLGTTRRSVQDWESGAYYPSAERLQALILVLLESGGLTVGREAVESHELWAAALREAPRMHTPLDEVWLDQVLAERAAPGIEPTRDVNPAEAGSMERRQDWGEAPDVIGFVGRAEELATLRSWVLEDRCRLAAVLGMGGIGKTALASRLAQDAAATFQRLYWRSLRDALPSTEWIAGAISFLSAQRLAPPEDESARRAVLLQLLRDRPSLLVLDNFETVLEPGQHEGHYRDGFAGYGALLQAVGDSRHQSCLLLTSREAPPELAILGGTGVRRFQLAGLGVAEAQQLLADKQLSGSEPDWADLITRFGGNGLALKVVGESIRQVFDGDIAAFLDQAGSTSVFGGIRRLLAEQIERSSALEQRLLRVLAVEREPVGLAELIADVGPRFRQAEALEAVGAARRRSLVERAGTTGAAAFTLQSVVLEYVTDRLVDDVSDEIERGQPLQLVEQPLIKAEAKDYVRDTQERLIGEPILERVRAHGDHAAEKRLLGLLDGWRNRTAAEQGYGPGNAVNLLRLLRGNLRGLDLGHLALRQTYLAGVDAQDSSLAGAHLFNAVLAEAFDFPASVALGADGTLLAAGTSTGQVWLWRVADRTLVAMLEGHTGPVWGLALAPDGKLLASGGGDGTVRLWNTSTGHGLGTLHGHTGAVWTAALAADGRLLASGAEDGTVRLWEASTLEPLAILRGHTGPVRAVGLTANGQILASGGQDGIVRLWEASSGRSLAILQGHTGGLWGLALSADGELVASGGQDGTVRLWEANTGRSLAILQGHTGGVWSVALSADGQMVASGGGDGTVRLWDSRTEQPLGTLQGHTGTVWGAALSADGRLLASGGGDGSVRLWEAARAGAIQGDARWESTPDAGPSAVRSASLVAGWRPLATLQGHTSGVRAVALAADGKLVASGGQDGMVRLWEASTGRPLATLQGHTRGLWGVALSADGRLLSSGGGDGKVRLWDAGSSQLLVTLPRHADGVWSLALSADGRLVASGSGDGTVRLWDAPFPGRDAAERWAGRGEDVEHALAASRRRATLQVDTSAIAGLALSADGELVAAGGADGTVRVWQTSTGRLLATLQGHTSAVWGMALSADSQRVVSGSEDGTIRLWDLPGGRALAILHDHTSVVYGVALASDGKVFASGGADGTVRLWEASTGRPLATLRGHTGVVRGVALSADGQLVASAGFDETVRLWNASTGACLRIMRSARRYERVDITGLTGTTDAQRRALIALGAVDRTT